MLLEILFPYPLLLLFGVEILSNLRTLLVIPQEFVVFSLILLTVVLIIHLKLNCIKRNRFERGLRDVVSLRVCLPVRF